MLATGNGYESLPFRSEEVGRDQLTLLELQRKGNCVEYFSRQLLAPESIEQGLSSGKLVVDRRLAHFMTDLAIDVWKTGADARARPDRDAARRILADLFDARA